jgi:ribosomal protein L11 methyltransferase
MSWLRLRVQVPREQIEPVERLLESLGALSVTLQNAGTDPVLEPDPGETVLWADSRIEALFTLDSDVAALREAMQQAGLVASSVDFLDDQDWLNRWRQYAVEFCFADKLWIVPRDVESVVEPALRLDPGLAFGTGSHPTTRLCLSWLAGWQLEGLDVLDFGCGSGILALAALKLGASRVVAIDHDPQALLATRENAAYNGLLDERLIVGGRLAASVYEFDVVVANVLANPLIELSTLLSGVLRPGGALVLSGLLAHQGDAVKAAYPEMHFEPDGLETDEQGARWIRLVGLKSQKSR